MSENNESGNADQNTSVYFVPEPSDSRWDTIYEVIGFRRQATEALAWQAPIMSLTAQAFLMMIALGPDYSSASRAIAALLSLFTNFASWQTMAKHRMYEHEDAKWLAEYERKLLAQTNPEMKVKVLFPHNRQDVPNKFNGVMDCPKKLKSFWCWNVIAILFALVSFFVLFTCSLPFWHSSTQP